MSLINMKKLPETTMLYAAIIFASMTMLPIATAQLSCTTLLSNANVGGGAATCQILTTMCSIINTVTLVVGIIALGMFILGGLLYGFAHFMPSAGNLRAGMQGWGVGIIIGGVIATVIFLLAPFIINSILSTLPTNLLISKILAAGNTNSITSICGSITLSTA